ncbi:hypothetical protein [Paractinoplanes rishiriensis]|uniref:hypothetical protein n=1 Tax=Paractinoplanes rishiriensis TaxID=1050105 RepID=UPI001943626A|nr:hypothetical protein [Actinoplanes rishiriensis]
MKTNLVAARAGLAILLVLAAAIPMLGDMGVGGHPKQAAASAADRSRQVTAVSRATNTLDAFWVDAERRIMTAGYVPGSGWRAPAQIAGGMALSGTSVNAVARGASRLDIFSVAATRHVQTAFWNGSSWSGWFQLGSLRVMNPSSVHAIGGPDNLDIFAVGEDLVIYHNRWTSATEWSGWRALPGLTAAAGTMAYAVYPNGAVAKVHVFAVETVTIARVIGPPPGRLVKASWNLVGRNVFDPATGGWAGWDTSPLMTVAPRTTPYPISHRNGSVMLYGTDENGKTIHNGWSTRAGWGGWPELLSNGVPLSGATVLAAVRVKNPTAAEYAAVCQGTDGRAYIHHLGESGSAGWEQIPNSQIAGDVFLVSAGPDRYNAFAWSAITGGAQSAGWTPTGGWTGWTRIDD